MSQLKNGPISENELMLRLANASKVMKKVEGNEPTSKAKMVNDNYIDVDSMNDDDFYKHIIPESSNMQNSNAQSSNMQNLNDKFNIEKIQKSKLPDVIKQAMIEKPIQQVHINETLDMNFIKGAKKLIEQENSQMKKTKNGTDSNKSQSTKTSQVEKPTNLNALSTMIENIVRKVMDEKINQLLTAHETSSINENLVLKVGDSIFKGKITGVKKSN